MAPQYKLTYFNAQALGEPIRYFLAYGKLDFEDNRIDKAKWTEKLKSSMPFGKMPLLEFEGKAFHQHISTCRYLARKLNLLGKTDEENAEIDSFVDTISDLRGPLMSYFYDDNPATKAPKLAPLQNEIVPYYVGRFEEIVKKNGGHVAGKQLTWGDVYLASVWDYLKLMSEVNLDKDYPNLSALVAKVNNLPQIKAWIAKRPPQ